MNLETMIELYNSGKTLRQIGQKANLDFSVVYKQLKGHVTFRPKGSGKKPHVENAREEARALRTRGLTYREIGDKLAVSPARAHQLANEK
jgi:hypothetical protein